MTSISQRAIHFAKMHGAGNDYVYVTALDRVPEGLSTLAEKISDRHFGVGGDGLVVITGSDVADFRMRMFNSDGSEAQMCGNAIRCVAKLIHDKGLSEKNPLTIETLAGIRVLELRLDSEGKVSQVRVDMGEPVLEPALVPVRSAVSGPMVSEDVEVEGRHYKVTAVSMGNPHGVIFSDELTDPLVHQEGPQLEVSGIWPEKANIEFVKVLNRKEVEMRVWERGSGETLACGTGSCATVVAGVLNSLTERQVTVHLLGGDLEIEWSEEDNHVYMTGPATLVAEGVYYYQETL